MRVDEQYILSHFDEAIEKGHIRAYFQPVYRLLPEKICDAEALARWVDPELGMLSPIDFIPVLEEHRLIYRLDMAVLRQTCAFYRHLQERGTPLHSFSVNISRLDFEHDDLFDSVRGILGEYSVPSDAIKIEITESMMLDDAERFREVIARFQEAGMSVWIDDFGSGYSSLNVLQTYHFDMLKIDMLFLRDFGYRSRQVVSAIVNMAKSIGMHTLAEGIENEQQLLFLKTIGCECVQGYYYSRPLDARAFIGMIDADASVLEPASDRAYWETIGRFNLLSTNPMEDFAPHRNYDSGIECSLCQSDLPLSLIEYRDGIIRFLFANRAYRFRLEQLGVGPVEALQGAFNSGKSPQYPATRSLYENAIARGTVQMIDCVTNGFYYTQKAMCLAKADSKAMLAVTVRTFESEQGERRSNEAMRYSQALFATYEHVDVLYPARDAADRIFSIENFEHAYHIGTLRDGIRAFCRSEVIPEDQERYLRFFDLDTLEARIDASENRFVQQAFRINSVDKGYVWRTIRITRIPSVLEDVYLFTMQRISAFDTKIAETLLKEHPELLEE